MTAVAAYQGMGLLMRQSILTLLLLMSMASMMAVEPLATLHQGNVTVSLEVSNVVGADAVLVGRFVPDVEPMPLHLYSKDLPRDGAGMPTLLELPAGSPMAATGPLTADREPHDLEGLPVYPEGSVTLRLPIRLPSGAVGSQVPVTVLVTYMACSVEACKRPVVKKEMLLSVPAVAQSSAPAATDPAVLSQAVRHALEAERATLRQTVAEEIARALAVQRDNAGGVRFTKATSVAEAERLIADAHRAGKSVILDFTGPSCTVCQRMARTVLRDPRAIAAWNAQVPIEIDTDSYGDLAAWQVDRFKTQNRPLYVRLDPPREAGAVAGEERWSQVFTPDQATEMAAFVTWSAGGVGADAGLGEGLLAFLLLAFAGGLFTLVMPCTYPMIPFTVNFFAKQAAGGKKLVPLAAFYAGGIVLCFVGVGVLVTGVLQVNLAQLSGHPLTNLLLGILFLTLGLSLLGAFLLHLPPALENALGGGRAGYLGALGMGLTFAITAFACTAPFAGAVLTAAVSSGTTDAWLRAIIGMGVYSGVVAVPFFFLAISPGLLAKLPKAGGWMNEFKVVGGIVEIAAALKFLNIADHHWHWGVFGRDMVFALWAASTLAIAGYVLGYLRFNGDAKVTEVGAGRLLTGVFFAALAIWIASGLFGNDLGMLESFLAPEA